MNDWRKRLEEGVKTGAEREAEAEAKRQRDDAELQEVVRHAADTMKNALLHAKDVLAAKLRVPVSLEETGDRLRFVAHKRFIEVAPDLSRFQIVLRTEEGERTLVGNRVHMTIVAAAGKNSQAIDVDEAVGALVLSIAEEYRRE